MRYTPRRASRLRFAIGLLLVGSLALGAELRAADRLVLLEKFSATWCPHCASASQDLDDLLQTDGDRFVTFDAFTSTAGRYATNWGISRAEQFYFPSGFPGYPTVVFDGSSYYAGSTNAQSVYLNAINQRADTPTDVVLNMTAVTTGQGAYDVTTSVSVEAGGTGKTMRIYIAQALENYGVYDDPGATEAHNTFMQIVESGFDVTLAPGQSQSLTRSLTLDADSVNQLEDVRLIAWAQQPFNVAAAEVYNAAQTLLVQAHPADFNSNGSVNGADLALWEDEFGVEKLPYQGADGTGDGLVAGGDFLLWQQHHGAQFAGAAAAAAVPEPSATMLLIAAALLGVLGRAGTSPTSRGATAVVSTV